MPGLCGCELCERPDVEAVGTTHFGGCRFEVCADCRGIVSQARGQIAALSNPTLPALINRPPLQLTRQWTGRTADEWNNHGSVLLPAWCPGCARKGSVGVDSCEGKPGCSWCLRPLQPGEIR